MIGKTGLLLLGMTLGLALGQTQTALASSMVSIAPSGDGSYVVQGIGVESAAAMDITVTYDPATLASPQFTQGTMISGATVAVNDTIPGTVRIGIVRTTPVTGTGIIATLTFTRKGDGSGRILALKSSISNIDGKSLPVISQIPQQSDTAVDVSNTSVITGELATTSIASTALAGAELAAKLVVPSGKSEDKGDLSAERSSGTGTAWNRRRPRNRPRTRQMQAGSRQYRNRPGTRSSNLTAF